MTFGKCSSVSASRQYSQHSLINSDWIPQEHQNLWRRHGRKYEISALKMLEIAFQGRKTFPGKMFPDPLDSACSQDPSGNTRNINKYFWNLVFHCFLLERQTGNPKSTISKVNSLRWCRFWRDCKRNAKF